MHVALYRGVQPLQARAHPMWQFSGAGDEDLGHPKIFTGEKLLRQCKLSFLPKGPILPGQGGRHRLSGEAHSGQGLRTHLSSIS